MEKIKVSANSRSVAVAGAVAGVLRDDAQVEIQTIGPHALNQAVKGLVVARKYLQADGLDLVCTPGFTEVEIRGEERTAIRLLVERRLL
ncbi:MAG: stage V sporulation protein S [Caldilineales bacterium]